MQLCSQHLRTSLFKILHLLSYIPLFNVITFFEFGFNKTVNSESLVSQVVRCILCAFMYVSVSVRNRSRSGVTQTFSDVLEALTLITSHPSKHLSPDTQKKIKQFYSLWA